MATVHEELLLVKEQLFLLKETLYDVHVNMTYGKEVAIILGASAVCEDIRRKIGRITRDDITGKIEIPEKEE